MIYHYLLDENNNIVPCDLMTWAEWFQKNPNRHVRKNEIDGVRISTVFMGLDHNLDESGPPLLFETMIFGGEHDQYQERYSTYDAAIVGHEIAVGLVKRETAP